MSKSTGHLRVLVVEDNHDTADVLAELLHLWGYQVYLAYDGIEGLEEAILMEPDVVLLDIAMPHMDGYTLAEQLVHRPRQQQPLVVAISGYGQEADRLRSIRAGIHMHLLKPVPPEELHELLERFHSVIYADAHAPCLAESR